MKRYNILLIFVLMAMLLSLGCKKLDRLPETSFTDDQFWNTENDLINAANRMYQQLIGYSIDNRGDDNVNQTGLNEVSNGNRGVPGTSDDWKVPYQQIYTANNILEKAGKAQVTDAVKNRYFAEARFFRAYAYAALVQKYGDVPLLLKTLTIESPELNMPRTARATVVQSIYDDLDYAALWLPARAALPTAQYGRVTKSAAWALKSRVALNEGTRGKFFNTANYQQNLQIAVQAATSVMGQGHSLFASYQGMFTHDGEGPGNTENVFVKLYGLTAALGLTHNTSRDLENGRIAPTRNLIRMFLYKDGLPAYNTDNTPSATRSPFFVNEKDETGYNTILDNRDPRITTLVYRSGEQSYQRPWVPGTSLGTRSAYAAKKGFNAVDWTTNGNATVHKSLIRYAEVLLIYAEAKYEMDGTITDADLNLTVNALRTRAGLTAKLTNSFVLANNLSMREEIRRERTVELSLEGFRYTDLMRWKTAETVLPKTLLGARFNAIEWVGTASGSLNLNADGVLVVEDVSKRTFNPARDYLYPVPLQEISLSSNNVTQNPGWN
ncbi:RagB/SusD family nutrient uptake outer membrane protein [Pedobacter sp. PAMC26386]|nr:RagB/SusD family nutrient uptake outer membrane protein [Pedobacter sp. PAMC26386]